MFRFPASPILQHIMLLSAALFPISSYVVASDCEPIERLGTSNLDRFDYTVSIDISKKEGDCSYLLSVEMKHDVSLPIPTDPDTQCDHKTGDPSVFMAPDGIPYFGLRPAYETVPEEIKMATGIDSISMDFNPCGHPPYDAFTIPHYDIHMYMIDSEYRRCMTCDNISSFLPTCAPDITQQSTPSGRGFFNVNTVLGTSTIADMPAGFEIDPLSMIPLMGAHGWDFSNQPSPTNPWVEPVYMMGSYNGDIVFFETMIPHAFMSGDTDSQYEEEFTYVGQTIDALPSKKSVTYDSSTGKTTIVFEGKSNVCPKAKAKSKKSKAKSKNPKNHGGDF
mmetsp:Transcript_3416/g.4627  ORF Transcript_3416/g.4627 Transcript_3416/m.4627 type:complete len:334 (+) Transcript_3416:126-1127(+)